MVASSLTAHIADTYPSSSRCHTTSRHNTLPHSGLYLHGPPTVSSIVRTNSKRKANKSLALIPRKVLPRVSSTGLTLRLNPLVAGKLWLSTTCRLVHKDQNLEQDM